VNGYQKGGGDYVRVVQTIVAEITAVKRLTLYCDVTDVTNIEVRTASYRDTNSSCRR
jgi:hypothetical protein